MTGLRSSSTISGHFVGQPRHAQQHVAQRLDVGRRLAAIALQQRKPADLVQQLVGVAIGQRRDAEPHVAEQLDVDAAEAESRSAARTGDRRRRRSSSRRRRSASAGSARRRRRRARRPASPRAMMSSNARRTASSFCRLRRTPPMSRLVLDAGRQELRDDRKPEHARRARRHRPRCARRRSRTSGRPNACSTRRISSSVSQVSPRASTAPPADGARVLGVDVVESPEQPGRLRAPFRVGRDLRQRARGVLRERVRRACVRRRRRAAGGRPGVGHHAGQDRLLRGAGAACRRRSRRGSRSMVAADWRHVDRREDDDQRVGVRVGERDLDRLPVLVRTGRRDHVDRIAGAGGRPAETPPGARASRRRTARPSGRPPRRRRPRECRARRRW